VTAERKVVVIGAGALGLGFLGPEFSSEAQVWFLDTAAKRDVLTRIERDRAYTLNVAAELVRPARVKNVRGQVIADDEAKAAEVLAGADLCFTAVGDGNLAAVAPLLARAARMRPAAFPLSVLCAENGPDAAKTLSQQIGEGENAAVSDTVMGRMCRWLDSPEGGCVGLFGPEGPAVVAEDFRGIPYRRSDRMPDLSLAALRPREEARFALDEHVKLFAHNCVHGLFACAAARRGLARINEIGEDAHVRQRAERMLYDELMPALAKQHAGLFDRAEYTDYAGHLVRRILSPTLADTVARGVRGAAEKLRPNGRWAAAVRFVRGAGIAPIAYYETIADVIAVSGLLSERDLSTVLAEHCGFSSEQTDEMLPVIQPRIVSDAQ
jgi:mannitol-1-phosphate/altronate dehydrogenase